MFGLACYGSERGHGGQATDSDTASDLSPPRERRIAADVNAGVRYREADGTADSATDDAPVRQPATGLRPDADTDTDPDSDASTDPGPSKIDPGTVVATSGSQLVFTRAHYTTGPCPGPDDDCDADGTRTVLGEYEELRLLDLESGAVHDLDSSPGQVMGSIQAPDGMTLLVGGDEHEGGQGFFLARLSDDGFVSAAPIANMSGVYGYHYLMNWSADGRFAALRRVSSGLAEGFDVIDTWTNTRHVSLADGGDGRAFVLGPRGDWFHYHLSTRALFGRIPEPGSAEPFDWPSRLPDDGESPTFSMDGSRLFYVVREPGGTSTRLFALELTADDLPEPIEIDSAVSGETLSFIQAVEAEDEHLLAVYTNASGRDVLRRVAIDGAAEKPLLSDPERSVEARHRTRDGSAWLFRYYEPQARTVYLELVRGAGARSSTPLAEGTVEEAWGDVAPIGQHHMAFVSEGLLHVAAFDSDGEVAVSTVSAGEGWVSLNQCASGSARAQPSDRHAFIGYDTQVRRHTIGLLDLSAPTAARVATLMPHADATIKYYECPVWSPSGDALAYVEQHGRSSTIYLVRWGAQGPEAPVAVHEADGLARVEMVRP